MGDTKIEWAEKTWNPIRSRTRTATAINGPNPLIDSPLHGKIIPAGIWGYHCEHVSPGCINCYAERMNGRTLPAWGTGLDYTVPNRDKVEIYIDEAELLKPLHWRKPCKIFPGSMTDWCAEFVTDEMRDRMLAVAALTPRHTYLFLTKRADRMRQYFNGIHSAERYGELNDAARAVDNANHTPCYQSNIAILPTQRHGMVPWNWPLANVWLGVSVEDRPRLERVKHLRGTTAAVRWLSLEPLLEDLGEIDLSGIDWVVIGGESGPGARPMDVAWARSLLKQCREAGVAAFMKQLGGAPHSPADRITHRYNPRHAEMPQGFSRYLNDRKGADPEEWPQDLHVREYPEVPRV